MSPRRMLVISLVVAGLAGTFVADISWLGFVIVGCNALALVIALLGLSDRWIPEHKQETR